MPSPPGEVGRQGEALIQRETLRSLQEHWASESGQPAVDRFVRMVLRQLELAFDSIEQAEAQLAQVERERNTAHAREEKLQETLVEIGWATDETDTQGLEFGTWAAARARTALANQGETE